MILFSMGIERWTNIESALSQRKKKKKKIKKKKRCIDADPMSIHSCEPAGFPTLQTEHIWYDTHTENELTSPNAHVCSR